MSFALAALTFGFVAGLKPGPLGIFVIHQTMSKGHFSGFMASLTPIITDGPIIVLTLILTQQFSDLDWFISGVSICGAIYLAYISYKIVRAPGDIDPYSGGGGASSLGTAIKINVLNPAPYIFWLTIGSSYLAMGSKIDVVLFIACLSLSLCATKFGVAVLIRKLAGKFNTRIYSIILKALTLPLLAFSIRLMYSGISVWL